MMVKRGDVNRVNIKFQLSFFRDFWVSKAKCGGFLRQGPAAIPSGSVLLDEMTFEAAETVPFLRAKDLKFVGRA